MGRVPAVCKEGCRNIECSRSNGITLKMEEVLPLRKKKWMYLYITSHRSTYHKIPITMS